jgi:signal transduction histidine kinase
MSGDAKLASIIQAIGTSNSAEERAEEVLRTSMQIVAATAGAIFLLDTGTAAFLPEVALGPDRPSRPLAADRVVVPAGGLGSVADLGDVDRRADGAPERTGIAVYVSRGDACIAIMQLEADLSEGLVVPAGDSLKALASLLAPVYEQRFDRRLRAALTTPLPLASSDQEFFRSLAGLAKTATSAACVLLRRRTTGTLACVAAAGLRDDHELNRWDLSPIDDYPLLSRVLDGETLLVSVGGELSNPEVSEGRYLHSDETVAILPIRLAGENWGALSVGLRGNLKPTPMELDGFQATACMVGLALGARAGLEAISEQHRAQSAMAALAVEVEIGRSVRHEIKNRLANCQVMLHNLNRGLRDTPLAETVDGISEQLVAVDRAFDGHTFARISPTRQALSLQQTWTQALKALEGQLEAQGIAVRYVGPDVTVPMSPERMLQALLNLLLNSIAAFRQTNRRRRRAIDLHVREPAAKAKALSIIYTDTAGGIDRSSLIVPMPIRDKPLDQLIFEPGVTSKVHGTGFGLWLVRQILGEHHGSIDLVSHRGGVTFAIQLPRSGN